MYRYRYVRVTGEGVAATKFQEHRELIDRCAAEGWRFAGWVPAHITRGSIERIDLIFEQEAEEET